MSTSPIDPRLPDVSVGLPKQGHSAAQERSRQETEADAERFERAFQGDQNQEQETREGEGRLGGQPGDAILQSMLGQLRGPAESAPAQDSAQTLSDMAAAVADRILVSEPGQDPEIRIQLKDSILAGTEIRITRQDGSWQIQCLTTSPESARYLLAEKEAFQDALRRRLKDERVSVTVDQSTPEPPPEEQPRNPYEPPYRIS